MLGRAASAAEVAAEALAGAAGLLPAVSPGQACTSRSSVIKVAAEVVVTAGRMLVRLSGAWPHGAWYQDVCSDLCPGAAAAPSRSA